MRVRLIALVVMMTAALVAVPLTGEPNAGAASVLNGNFFFHGQSPSDDPAKQSGPPYTATFNNVAPATTNTVTQTATGFGDPNYAGNPLGDFWVATIPAGTFADTAEFQWYWASSNATAIAVGAEVTVRVYANADPTTGAGTQLGTVTTTFAVAPTPTLQTTRIALSGTVNPGSGNLLIQVTPDFSDTGQGLTAFYDSTDTPSGFTIPAPPLTTPPPPPITFAAAGDKPVSFAPATVVSAHFLGGEPQTTIERPIASSPSGVVDPNNVYIDWPLSTRSQVGQLSRSRDGGDSFRLLIDPACAARSRPTCATGGGGDTEEAFNPVTGDLFFADQEALAQESLASSLDHGDTWPQNRQFAASSAATGVDRQWLAAAPPDVKDPVSGASIHAFYAYHVPAAGQFVVGVDDTGTPHPPAAPQVLNVSQSGQLRVDMSNGPGHGWIYQPFRNSGYKLATADGKGNWIDPSTWQVNNVSSTNPVIFPWLALDTHGNAYAAWVADNVLYYSFSLIDAPANNPQATPTPGRPGTQWSAPVRVSPMSVGSSVFPEIVAGDPGHVAIAFDGTDWQPAAGQIQDDAPAGTQWHTYVAMLSNGLAQGNQPVTIRVGRVDHRTVHVGSVCTSGTTCTGDRSLLDLIDIDIDQDGRVGIVYTDNNSLMQTPDPAGVRESPFTLYAKIVSGPNMFAGKPDLTGAPAIQSERADASGDATWPNRADGTELPSLDALGASVRLDGFGNLVARVPLRAADEATMTADLSTYNGSGTSVPPAERLQYVVRFATDTGAVRADGTTGDVYHLSMDFTPGSGKRFFGGKLDGNDGLLLPGSTAVGGSGYHTDANIHVIGFVDAATNTLVLQAPAADFGVGPGTKLLSVTGFTMAGPSEANEVVVTSVMRTVDATPPFDTILFKPATGYRLVASDGGVFTFGDDRFFGSTGDQKLNKPVVAGAATPDGQGYWLVASDGGVFTFGDAGFFGSTGAIRLNKPIVGMTPTPSGRGYWLVASDGGIFAFGDAAFLGSTGSMRLNQPVVGMMAAPTGDGYWLVARDGGIFTFGTATFHGSTGGMRLNQPVTGGAPTPSGNGYWLVAADGGIFTFGDAPFLGSMGGTRLTKPVFGMVPTPSGLGYWLVAFDGGVFTFGDGVFLGSTGDRRLNQPVIAMIR